MGDEPKRTARGEEALAVVRYPDLAFLLNSLTDLLALSATALLAGLPLRWRRLLAAAVLGGVYGALCLLPPLAPAGGPLPQTLIAALLVWVAFGRRDAFLRRLLLFWLLSCTLGGVLLVLGQALREGGWRAVAELNWTVCFLAGGGCYLLLSLVFRKGAGHALARELSPCAVELRGRRAELVALLDSGHTLTDGATGRPVLIAEAAALTELWRPEERRILASLGDRGPLWCLERLGKEGRFRLLPYRAVGLDRGLLLCFRADRVVVGKRDRGPLTVALSPTPVSDGGGYAALWGEREGEGDHAA